MNRTTTKKLFGGILIVSLVATIGAVLGTAETDDSMIDKENPFDCFELGRSIGGHQPFYSVMANDSINVDMPFGHFRGDKEMNGSLPFFSELTEEQQNEIESLRESMIGDGASPEEIRDAITSKLEEYGFDAPSMDDQLDDKIERTTQRLEILNRQKELRCEGYSFDEIRDMISVEFELEFLENHNSCFMPYGGSQGIRGKGSNDLTFEDTDDSDI